MADSVNVAYCEWEHFENDAEFIAHAREDIPFLLAEVERLKVENERMRHESHFDKRGMVAPCKVGDTVYRIGGPKNRKKILERTVYAVTLAGCSVSISTTKEDWLNKTVFLTREEAETALARMEEKHGSTCKRGG